MSTPLSSEIFIAFGLALMPKTGAGNGFLVIMGDYGREENS
ncbi:MULTISPECIES: hypothetical protein [Synechocystis]|nr:MULTISPECIES: hypothetical protein [Synechocystis]